MYELSLFSGAGGGTLATKYLLGWQTIGYVEWDGYCQKVIAARIKDGLLDNAPIFTDIRAFNDSGCAELYRGVADVITAGFPCQPFSIAGKRKSDQDERNMWPATMECIRLVRPKFTFLENVPGLLNSGYFGRILSDLAQSGYDCRWRILSGAELGAPTVRKRVWMCAWRSGRNSTQDVQIHKRTNFKSNFWINSKSSVIQDAFHNWEVAHKRICGVDDRTTVDVDRLRTCGNGWIPAVAAEAWNLLTEDLINE